MAEAPSHQPISAETDSETIQYWCYHCDKKVSVETLPDLPDVICHECKNGFVESIATAVDAPPSPLPPPPPVADRSQEPSFSRQFLQVLRLIAQAARHDAAPSPPADPVSDPSEADDFLRIELDGWDNDDEDNDVDTEEIDFGNYVGDRSDNEDRDDEDQEDYERERRRRRSDILRLRIRDLASRASSGRNRILDWSDILTGLGLDDSTIEFRVEMPESGAYVGNPEDYVDAGGYEALLQNLAESDGAERRGAPPASRSALSALQTVEITPGDETLICAICKESVPVGETAKKLPCGHGYHGDCIMPWLGSRNSCPVCRFELPTDDREYEEEKKKSVLSSATAGGSSNSGRVNSGSG